MKRIIIICEGETEQEFCEKTLFNYFFSKDIHIFAPILKHSNGGVVHWNQLKKQIETTLRSEPQSYVTTLIDYYGMLEKHHFPGWCESLTIVDKNDRMIFLENQMKADVDVDLCHRFIPYIQLHEFEGLLFCNIDIFKQLIPSDELLGIHELMDVINNNPNPEMINNTLENSPSHRLSRIIKGYNKIVYGNILAETIGISTIRAKCPRFSNWLTCLEGISEI